MEREEEIERVKETLIKGKRVGEKGRGKEKTSEREKKT